MMKALSIVTTLAAATLLASNSFAGTYHPAPLPVPTQNVIGDLLAAITKDSHPFALTGEVTAKPAVQSDRTRFTDDKGHYRPDWAADINRPSGK